MSRNLAGIARRHAILAVTLGALVAAPDAAARQYFFQFNMQGNVLWDGQVRPVVPAIMRSILDDNHGPVHAVSLNEVCRQQFRALRRRLDDHREWPMHGEFVVTDPDGGGDARHCQGGDREGPGHDYGIAVFTRRAITNVQSWPLPHPANGETRKLLCVTTTLAGRSRTKVCTTHITNGDGKRAQIREVRQPVNRFVRAGRPVVLMGDFNVERTMGPWTVSTAGACTAATRLAASERWTATPRAVVAEMTRTATARSTTSS
jgi:hypothetical protein